MELYPERSILGYEAIAWSLRHWIRRRKSAQWFRTKGIVEGYEFLAARDNGWFVVFYSYGFASQQLSGEWRKWLLFTSWIQDKSTRKIIDRLPIGTKINVRVNPSNPNESVAEL